MDYLPIFADLKQRPVLVVGGGDVAARKVDLLQRAGAEIRIVAQSLSPELELQRQRGQLLWLGKTFDPPQLDDVFLAIAATDDNALNAAVFAEADKRRVLANVVDDQPRCSFIFPSIIDRSPLVVAVSSSGRAPVLARLLRESWRRCCPPVWGRWRRWRAAGAAGQTAAGLDRRASPFLGENLRRPFRHAGGQRPDGAGGAAA